MHIKMPEFPKAAQAVEFDEVSEEYYVSTELESDDFWLEGWIDSFKDFATGEHKLTVVLSHGDFEPIRFTQPCGGVDKKSVTKAYNEALKQLKSRYTAWVYMNIFGQPLEMPTLFVD